MQEDTWRKKADRKRGMCKEENERKRLLLIPY